MRPVKWEYALLYISDEEPPRRWILFSHEQDAGLDRFAARATNQTATAVHFEPESVHTTWVLGVLGEEGWELVGSARIESLDASCLYLKRELTDGRRVGAAEARV